MSDHQNPSAAVDGPRRPRMATIGLAVLAVGVIALLALLPLPWFSYGDGLVQTGLNGDITLVAAVAGPLALVFAIWAFFARSRFARSRFAPADQVEIREPDRRAWYARQSTWTAASAGALGLALLATAGYLVVDTRSEPVEFHPLDEVKRIAMDGSQTGRAWDPSVAVLGERAYLAWHRNGGLEVIAVDATTGGQLWRKPVPHAATHWQDIAAVPGAVVATTSGTRAVERLSMWVLDAETGNARWSREVHRNDRLIDFDGVYVLVSPADGVLRGLDPVTGRERWSLRGGYDVNSVIPVTAGPALTGPGVYREYGSTAYPSEDLRLVQRTVETTLNVIDVRSGAVVRSRQDAVNDTDALWAFGGRLYAATTVKGYRISSYDLATLGDPRLVYTSPPQRYVRDAVPCGTDRLCLLEEGDETDPEVVAVDTAVAQERWRRPARYANRLVPVGDRVLATNVVDPLAAHLFNPTGEQVLPEELRKFGGARVNAAGVLLFSVKLAGVGAAQVRMFGVDTASGRSTDLGTLPHSLLAWCRWNEAYLVCPGDSDFGIWRFRSAAGD